MISSTKLFTRGILASAVVALGIGVAADAGDDSKKAEVGEKAPDFTLTDTQGNEHTLSEYTEQGKIVVLEWFNPMCPFVVRHHKERSTMADTYNRYKDDDVVWLAINSAHENHPTAGKDQQFRNAWNIEYPILADTSGKVGRMYGAKTTPHMYIIDAEGTLVYAGAIDSDRSGSKSPGEVVNYVAQALEEVTSGKPVTEPETQPYGCSVKYARK